MEHCASAPDLQTLSVPAITAITARSTQNVFVPNGITDAIEMSRDQTRRTPDGVYTLAALCLEKGGRSGRWRGRRRRGVT